MSKPANPRTAPVCLNEVELSRRATRSRTTVQTMRSKGGGPPLAGLGHGIVFRLADMERWPEQVGKAAQGRHAKHAEAARSARMEAARVEAARQREPEL